LIYLSSLSIIHLSIYYWFHSSGDLWIMHIKFCIIHYKVDKLFDSINIPYSDHFSIGFKLSRNKSTLFSDAYSLPLRKNKYEFLWWKIETPTLCQKNKTQSEVEIQRKLFIENPEFYTMYL
jgi:hypothetical protein